MCIKISNILYLLLSFIVCLHPAIFNRVMDDDNILQSKVIQSLFKQHHAILRVVKLKYNSYHVTCKSIDSKTFI